MEKNSAQHQITFADKVEKWVNDPKSVPVVMLIIFGISMLLMSQLGNPVG